MWIVIFLFIYIILFLEKVFLSQVNGISIANKKNQKNL